MRDYYSEYLVKCGKSPSGEVSKVSKGAQIDQAEAFDTFDTFDTPVNDENLAESIALATTLPIAGTAMGRAVYYCSCGMCAYVGGPCPHCGVLVVAKMVEDRADVA